MLQFGVYATEQTDDGIGGVTEGQRLVHAGFGYLDMLTGSNQNGNQNSLVVQSTHLLIIPDIPPDYKKVIKTDYIIKAEGRDYRIEYVDNPVSINHHLEVYLKGEQNG